MFIAQDAKEDKYYNYCYLHGQQHICIPYHIISDRCTSCTISIDHHSRNKIDREKKYDSYNNSLFNNKLTKHAKLTLTRFTRSDYNAYTVRLLS